MGDGADEPRVVPVSVHPTGWRGAQRFARRHTSAPKLLAYEVMDIRPRAVWPWVLAAFVAALVISMGVR